MADIAKVPLVSVSFCWPPTASYLDLPNGTLFTGAGDWAIANIAGPKNIPIEFNINPSESSQTLRQIQTLYDSKADVFTVHVSMTHARYKMIDYSPALAQYPTRIMSRKVQGVMGSVIEEVFDGISYGLIGLSVFLFTAIFFWSSSNGIGFICKDKYDIVKTLDCSRD